MRNDDRLPICESSDFHYLLTLLPALKSVPEYRWLPELFSTLGYEKLVELCRYAGGETITLPTLQTLSNSIDALELFYNVYLTHKQAPSDIPTELNNDVQKIRLIFNAQNRAKFGDGQEV